MVEVPWYLVFDTFLGRNGLVQDVKRALALAPFCKHEYAQWLTRVCASCLSREDVIAVLKEKQKQDGLTFFFLSALSVPYGINEALLRQSAALGCSLAQADLSMLCYLNVRERVKWAELAIVSGSEREAFFVLGLRSKCKSKARGLFFRSAQLGFVPAMVEYGKTFGEADVRRWEWWARAALLGSPHAFLKHFHQQTFEPVVYVIGSALNGRVDFHGKRIFDIPIMMDVFDQAYKAIYFFLLQNSASRKAVDAWAIIAKRVRMPLFVRERVSALIWSGRSETVYDHEQEDDKE